MTETIALVVAAGRGRRLGASQPKQYAFLAGRPLLRHALDRLAMHPRVDAVRVVIGREDRESYDAAARGLDLLAPVIGGETRQESVRLGLESLAALAPEHVLVHDAARPFVDDATIDRVLDALTDHEGAVPGLPVTDTLKRVSGTEVAETVPRSGLWRAQTPQGFRFDALLTAHRRYRESVFTDDSALAERAGMRVALVQGSAENLKITTAEDMMQAERWLESRMEVRVGHGADVHRFGSTPGPVRLCGVPVDHELGLEGHSDADVGLHVVVDAILGALSAGDIGQHFPPGDPRWKGADSGAFVVHARQLAEARGARILHVDVTLICERPKLAPHRERMVRRIAELLEIGADRVSVKATTTERLGFTGRGEGIAAQAIATLSVPAA